MVLTDELKDLGRRNFLSAIAAGQPNVAPDTAALTRVPLKGGPVRAALIGTGDMGTGHLKQCQKEFIDLKALCDINPRRRGGGVDILVKAGWPKPKEYDDWREMLEKEDLEAVIIAAPLWTHADISVGCLDAGKHVLCEKMMAKSEADCLRMIDASRRNKRLLEIGYQRYYNPMYQDAYNKVVKQGLLGDVYYARLAWHRNSTWRKKEDPPSPDFDPGKWGYPDWDHLLNWRMYKQYSEGLMAELGSHQLTAASWFFDSTPEAVYTAGGISRYKDGREVSDHVYATFEYPGGRTATFSSIQSNAHEDAYEMFMGTKGTLLLRHEVEAYLFNEGEGESAKSAADAAVTHPTDPTGRSTGAGSEKSSAYKLEIAEFCSAVRTGSPIRCGPQKAMRTAIACVTANHAAEKKARLEIPAIKVE